MVDFTLCLGDEKYRDKTILRFEWTNNENNFICIIHSNTNKITFIICPFRLKLF